jgi:hypothetical protein
MQITVRRTQHHSTTLQTKITHEHSHYEVQPIFAEAQEIIVLHQTQHDLFHLSNFVQQHR